MNIKESAKAYAEGKAVDALTAAIEQAYADGYNAGFNDGLASKKDDLPVDLDDGVEFVDLGLPSGTKWAAEYLKDKGGSTAYLTYDEAAKLNIPTKEQYLELIGNCVRKDIFCNKTICGNRMIGPNGNFVDYKYEYRKEGPKFEFIHKANFWLLSEDDNTHNRLTSALNDNEAAASSDFMGFGHTVVLVK